MKTLTIKFKSNGETIKKVAVIKDDLTELSTSKKNEADTIEHYPDDNFWSLCFGIEDNVGYEIEFKIEDYQRTLKPIKAITWCNYGSGYIDDVQAVESLTIK